MSVMRWLVRLLQPKEAPPARACPPPVPSWKKFTGGSPSSDYLGPVDLAQDGELAAASDATIERALRLSGVVDISPENIAYFQRIAAYGVLNYKMLVRDGPLMTAQEKRDSGLKTRAYVGSDFFSHLNDAGRADPLEAANKIACIFNKQQSCIDDLRRGPDFLDGDTRLRFFPSNMAAGPCLRASRLSKSLIEPSSAPIVPFEDCSHPDQCGCRYLMKRYDW